MLYFEHTKRENRQATYMFKSMIQNVPAAICGLALGTFTFSHILFQIHLAWLGLLATTLGSICLVLFFIKLIRFPKALGLELKNSNTFAIMPALLWVS